MKPTDRQAIGIIVSLALIVAYLYFDRIDRPNYEARSALHAEILAGTAPSPYRYRVLIPLVAEGTFRVLRTFADSKSAFLAAYGFLDLLCITAMLLLLYKYLRIWFDTNSALIAVLFVGGTMPITFKDHHFQPWSLLEPALFTAGLIAVYSDRYLPLLGLTVVAALNRETAIYIPLMYLVYRGLSEARRYRMEVLFLTGSCIVVLVGLRLLLGYAPHVISFQEALIASVKKIGSTIVNWAVFLGAFWLFAYRGVSHAPPFVRRTAWIVPLYIPAVLLGGIWYETRLLMPLYPFLTPLALSYLYASRTEQAQEGIAPPDAYDSSDSA